MAIRRCARDGTSTVTLLGLILSGAVVAFAQQPDSADRARVLDPQIDRIFQSREYELPRFGPVRWMADQAAYTTVERSAERSDGWDIVRYDARTGARTVLVDASHLVPKGSSTALVIDDYVWSQDGKQLLVFTNTKRVWRQNTRGDYWVLDLGSSRLRRLGGGAAESTLMFAKFSPDGSRVAYVRANNLFVERLDDGRITQITSDGSDTTINGTSDWVYEEELGVRDGFRWSPDGTQLAFWQFDSTGVGAFSLINDTDALYPSISRIPYPKAGTTNSAARIGVVSVEGGEIRWMRTPGEPRETYLARIDWVDRNTVAIQQLNRLQNRDDLLLADTRSGEVRRAVRDESTTWVNVVNDVRWLDKGQAFLWVSERDGWRHVFRVSRDGTDTTLITRFDADIIQIEGLDEAQGWLYFLASPGHAEQQFLYRSKLDGTGVPEQVTPANQPGTHAYQMSPTGRFALHTYSRFDRPSVIDLIEVSGHRSLRTLTNNSALETKLAPLLESPVEFFTIDIGTGVTLDGWMLKPSHFDAALHYPTIVYVYGEPASQTVVDRWGGDRMLFHRALADAGYIVLSVDNRGTPAPKGAAWRKVVYGTVGDLSSKDQAAAVRALAARYTFIDLQRIGVWGWSGGGSNTLNAMFRFPDVFRVGVSVAPVPDQRLYDTIYQERYMGLPQDNAEGYRVGSPINFAEGLQGKLLIVHGSGDDNVHYQGTERLVNRLVELGKPFDLMVYPNRTHGLVEGAGTTAHVHHLIARYFLEHLPAGGR
jgi:dipeptidyl-peptidase-4